MLNLYMLMQYDRQVTIKQLTPAARVLTLTPPQRYDNLPELYNHIRDLFQLMSHGLAQNEHIVLQCSKIKYVFPPVLNSSVGTSSNFHLVLHVLNVIVTQLREDSGGSRTLRSVFYDNVSLFGTQSKCVHWLNKICYELQVSCVDIGIVPSLKGLVYCHGIEVVVDESALLSNEVRLVPRVADNSRVHVSHGSYSVVVVEKDAIFHDLIGQIDDTTGNCVVITGKGYPDRNTTNFLQLLQLKSRDSKIQIVCDEDPHGVHITWQYLKKLTDWSQIQFQSMHKSIRSKKISQRLTDRDVVLSQSLVSQITNNKLRHALHQILFFQLKFEMSAESILSRGNLPVEKKLKITCVPRD